MKTRLIGDLTAAEAAALHAAFLGDLVERLREGDFELRLAWALDPGDEMPAETAPGIGGIGGIRGIRQEGDDLGERLYRTLSEAARESALVMAVGSDHPTLSLETVHQAFEALERGARVVIGPAEDGGYYLIALRSDAVFRRLFEDIDWSTDRVLAQTLERCREMELLEEELELLPPATDVDTPDDLRSLASRMAGGDLGCPRTRELLRVLHRLPERSPGVSGISPEGGLEGAT